MSVSQKKPTRRITFEVATKASFGALAYSIGHSHPVIGPFASGLAPLAADGFIAAASDYVGQIVNPERIYKQHLVISRISGLTGPDALKSLLTTTPFTRASTHQFVSCIRFFSANDNIVAERYCDWLCQVVIASWETDLALARFTAAILTGVGRLAGGYGDHSKSIRELIAKAVRRRSLRLTGATESLSFVLGLSSEESDILLYERMLYIRISELVWRAKDALEDVRYCGNLDASIATRFDHVISRRGQGLTDAHDAPRAIHLLTSVSDFKGKAAELLRERTLESLRWCGSLHRQAEYQLTLVTKA